MKRPVLIILMLCLILATSCRKGGSSCPWESEVLDGKTFRITKIIEMSGTTSTDVTTQRLADPCQSNARISFSGHAETISVPPSCTNNFYPNRSFDLTTENGTHYIVETPSGSSTTFKTEVSAYDCSSYTTVTDYSGSGGPIQYITYATQ